jgi:hypothetical protein
MIDSETTGPKDVVEIREDLEGYQKLCESFPSKYSIGFGPTYQAQSSGGIDLDVRTVLLKDNGTVLNYALIAADNKGQVVGTRFSELILYRGLFTSEGYIHTSLRGKGVSTVIDSAHVDLLQRLATQYNKPIECIISDTNTNKQSTSEEEKNRWRAQYSPGGKFGVSPKGIIAFRPQILSLTGEPEEEDIESIESIHLQRVIGHKHEPGEVKRVPPGEKPNLHQRNLPWFQQLCQSLKAAA